MKVIAFSSKFLPYGIVQAVQKVLGNVELQIRNLHGKTLFIV